MRIFLAILFLPSLIHARDPADIRPLPPRITAQAAESGRQVWHSRSFRIDSDIPISPHDLRKLATVADTTARAVENHPLPLYAPPLDERPRIRIHGSEENYRQEGGAPGTAGMYVWRSGTVLLNATHLFPADPGSRLQPIADEDLIVHELVHLCMHRVQHRVPQWFAEGIAEYFSCAHLGGGKFSFRDMDREIREHLRRRYDPGSPLITLVPIPEIAELDPRGWLEFLSTIPAEERYRTYATSLLITHYYVHGTKARRSEIRRALEKPRRDPALLKPAGPPTQDALARFWKPKGLTLRFPTAAAARNPLPP